MARTNIWHIVGRGFAGWHAQGIDVSSTGGDLMPYTYWTGAKCAGYAAEAVEGALVYDADGIRKDVDAAKAFVNFVVAGPICKPELTTDEGTGPLDCVTMATFERLLREIPGIRFGRVRGGQVVWEDEQDGCEAGGSCKTCNL